MLFLFFIISIPEWTVGCYFAADNGLDYAVLDDMEELTRVGSTSSVTVVIQVDRLGKAERYFAKKDSLVLLQEMGDINSGDPETLKEFGRWLGMYFPAEHYLLVVWDHGNGWEKKGICYEGSNFISIAGGEFREAIKSISSSLGKNIDILLLDACLMQMVEVASEVYPFVDFIVGSEQLVPDFGFPYDKILLMLTSDPSVEIKAFSDSISSFYVQYCKEEGIDAQASSIELTLFADLLQSLKNLTALLKNDPQNSLIRIARDSVQTFNFATSPPPIPEDQYVDICHFAELISEYESEVTSTAEEVVDLTHSMIFSKYTGESLENSKGLSVWFPYKYSQFCLNYSKYRNLVYAMTTEWEKFLFAYYGVPDTIPPTVPSPLPAEISGNSYTIRWESSYDLTDISEYELEEIRDVQVVLRDGCEDFYNFDGEGFVVSAHLPHSGEGCFFTKGGWLVSKERFHKGSFSFFRHQRGGNLRILSSKDLVDWSEIAAFSDNTEWIFETIDIDTESYVKIEFSGDDSWVYIDDISVLSLGDEEIVYRGTENSYMVADRPNGRYYYRVRARDGSENMSEWSEVMGVVVTNYLPPYNYPNPFNEGTYIVYNIPEDGWLSIFTVSGNLVREFEVKKENDHIFWDGRNEDGRNVASGIYICRLSADGFSFIFKIACVR
ncbi:MAG: clostripain-related cysteine peptidase [candidate division WOR-3 bacterium]|nr:clostripain-related cysteine peptidase [candidate division WOR-3 bacterium]